LKLSPVATDESSPIWSNPSGSIAQYSIPMNDSLRASLLASS
jgi:hypothetical protein